jgi:hypothetical protein
MTHVMIKTRSLLPGKKMKKNCGSNFKMQKANWSLKLEYSIDRSIDQNNNDRNDRRIHSAAASKLARDNSSLE